MDNRIFKYFRWVLGGVLLIAGVLKLITPDNLIEVILFFELAGETGAAVFVYTVSVLEIMLAVGLILNLKPKLVSIITIMLCINFLLISILGYANQWEFACGCLGEFTYGNFDLTMVIRNTVLVGLAGGIVIESYGKKAPKRGVIQTKRG